MTYATHDAALQALCGMSPELRNGAPNHAPMVVEALAALGACRRLEGLRPSPAFRGAAHDWVRRVEDSRGWSPQQLVDAGIRVRLPDA